MEKIGLECKCPLCSSHKDMIFVDSKVAGKPICERCARNLQVFFDEDDSRPNDSSMDRLETLTGKTFEECRRLWIEEAIEYFEQTLSSKNIEKEIAEVQKYTGQTYDEVIAYCNAQNNYYKKRQKKIEAA